MENYIGVVVKKLREKKNMKQKQLAENLCTIKQISRIELNISSPSVFLLTEISLKLGNDLLEYIPYSTDPNVYELKSEIDEIMCLFNRMRHIEAYQRISNSVLIKNTKCIYARQEIDWIIGALSNYVNINIEIDKTYYLNILRRKINFDSITEIFNHNLNPLEYRIVNSLIVLYLSENDYVTSQLLLNRAIYSYENNYNDIKDISYLRFIYNLSRLHFVQGNYSEARMTASKGIKRATELNTMSLLPDLYNIYGKSLYRLGNKQEGVKNIKNYINLSRIIEPSLNYEEVINNITRVYNIDL